MKAGNAGGEEARARGYKGGDRDRAIVKKLNGAWTRVTVAVVEARIATERLKDAYLGKVEAMDVVVEARIANERLKDASNKAPMTLTARL